MGRLPQLLLIGMVVSSGCRSAQQPVSDQAADEEPDSVSAIRKPPVYWAQRLRNDSVAVRRGALGQLGTYGREASPFIDQIADRVGDSDSKTGFTAAWTLAKIGLPAIPALQELLRSPTPEIRRRAAYGLGEGRVEDASAALDSVEANDPSPTVRGMAGWALDQINQRGASSDPTMIFAIGLDDPDLAVRIEAVKRIGVTAPSNRLLIPILIRLLADSVPGVRNAAIEALAQSGPVGASALSAALSGRNRAVRSAAILSLSRRTRSF